MFMCLYTRALYACLEGFSPSTAILCLQTSLLGQTAQQVRMRSRYTGIDGIDGE